MCTVQLDQLCPNGKCKRRHSFAKKARCHVSSEKFKKEDEDLKVFIQALRFLQILAKIAKRLRSWHPPAFFTLVPLAGFNFPPCALALSSTWWGNIQAVVNLQSLRLNKHTISFCGWFKTKSKLFWTAFSRIKLWTTSVSGGTFIQDNSVCTRNKARI
jgi:hypothetical protein